MTALVFGTVLPWLLIGVGTWLGFQLVRQNGRLLLRLETIEKQLAPRAGAKPREAGGLPIGMVAPDFELPDLTGVRHKLSEFRDRNVLLIFFNPQCGYCTKMAPDLAALRGRRRRPARTGRGLHRRCPGEPEARRAVRHTVPGPAAGRDGNRLEVPRPGNAHGISDRQGGAHRQRADRGRRASAATGSDDRGRSKRGGGARERLGAGWREGRSLAGPQSPEPEWTQGRRYLRPISSCRGWTVASCRWPTFAAGECCWCSPIPTAAPVMNWRRGYRRFTCGGRTFRCSW